LEGRKHIIKPLFTRWYRNLASHDIKNFYAYYKDSQRLNLKRNIAEAKEQMDYYLLHRDFSAVKAESLNRFLAHEQMNLQKHIHERSVSLLKAAKTAEITNSRAVVNRVVAASIEEVNRRLETDIDSIREIMFDSALIGISKGQMTYENDPLIGIAQETIRTEVAKVTSLSEAEQLRLVALTDNQMKVLKESDETYTIFFIVKNCYLGQRESTWKLHQSSTP